MYTLNDYCRRTFGEKLYKLSLDGGFTCPNRDGTLGHRGCIFCSAGGSGDFAAKPAEGIIDIPGQIQEAKDLVSRKMKSGGRYIAYFQAYTNTYGPLEKLEKLFTEAISQPEVAVLSIATRPDCLPEEVLELLSRLNRIKPVWIELGLQTIHPDTADYIRRGYPLSTYKNALLALKKRNLTVITHVILGLPGESEARMLETVDYLAHGIPNSPASLPTAPPHPAPDRSGQPAHSGKSQYTSGLSEASSLSGTFGLSGTSGLSQNSAEYYRTDGIKLQLLHVLKGTDLAKDYEAGKFTVMTLEQYLPLLAECIRRLPPDMVVHRITGDGPKKLLIAPLWTGDKKRVMNTITRYFQQNQVIQGADYSG